MAYSIYLSHALLTNPEHYAVVLPRLIHLERVSNCLSSIREPEYVQIEPGAQLFETIIKYTQKYKKLPNRQGMLDMAVELISRGAKSGFGDQVENQVTMMDEMLEESSKPNGGRFPTDIYVLIDTLSESVRKIWHQHLASGYAFRANGSSTVRENGVERKTTADDAIQWLRSQWIKDISREAPRPAGFLDQNTHYIEQEIGRMKESDDSDRIPTGFEHIDEVLSISKKLRPFIGIMGFANDGKTTILNTMLYNMAMEGKTVVLFTKEHDPLEVWMSFAFLHSYNYREEFTLPSLMNFQKKEASDEDWQNLNRIVQDIKNKTNIKGRIEVQRLTDWDTLVTHLTSGHPLHHYDVCAVDYLTRIDIPWGKPQFKNQDMATQIGMAQALTRDFNNGEGIVFITPIQINRTGYSKAKQKKEGEKKHDLTSVQQHSEFYQDMDLIISLFRDDVMKNGDSVLMEIQKVRGAAFPPSAMLAIDSLSRSVLPPGKAIVGDMHFQNYLSGKTQSPISKYMQENVIEQNVFDSLDLPATA